MTDQAWAVVITKGNFSAILSEAGGKLDRDLLERWLAQEGGGYFVRDKSTPTLDCNLFTVKDFNSLYEFSNGDEDALFRQIAGRR
jgi:hypothetical protein